jgi:hypothetical protein
MKKLSAGRRQFMSTEKTPTTKTGIKLGDKIAWALLATILVYEVLK